MRRVFFFIVLSFLVSLSGLSAQTNQATVHLKGKVLDTTLGAMVGATVKVYRGTAVPREGTAPAKEGISGPVGDFDLELPPGDYRIEVSAPDFTTFSQAVKLAADTAPLAVTLSVKEFETVINVAADTNEIGVDSDSSLTTDTILGDALLDLPDNEEDLLAYLTELAAARGIVDGELNIRVDGFETGTTGRLPNRNEIQEIRIVNSSFSADSSSSGPRIEIVTRPGTGNWTGRVGFTFADESLNAATPLTGRKPAQQQRNFTANVGGPLIPGRVTATFDVQNSQRESEGSAIRAIGINGPVNEGVANLSNSRNITFRPTITLNRVHSLVSSFSYSDSKNDNSGIGTYTLPERATNGRNHNWSLQMTERATISARLTNEFRFQVRQTNSNTVPVTIGRAINVTQSFQSGGATNRSQDRNQDFLIGNNFRWQTTRNLTLQGSLQVDHHNSLNNAQNNYLGTYSFSSLHDYCYAEALANGGVYVGSECFKTQALINAGTPFYTVVSTRNGQTVETQIPITGVPTQFSITSGDPILKVSQSELTAFLQGEWRMNPRAQLSFGARYTMQEHLKDYNNVAPTIGLSYQLSRKQNWQTVVRAGGRMNYSTFSMGTWEQLLRNDGFSRQFSTIVTSPTYPNPNLPTVASNQVALANSIRVRAGDYQSPYTIQPSLSIDQSLPKGHRVSFNFQVSRGLHQNRNRNINSPFPGNRLEGELADKYFSQDSSKRAEARAILDTMRPFFPIVSNITQQESSGSSLTKNFSVQYRVQNKMVLGNKVQIGGTVSWNMNWANDDNGNPLNPYDLDAEWGRSSNDQRHRITGSLNLQVPGNMRFTFQQLGWSSGRPYTVTTGRDENGDTSNNDRAEGYKKNSETGPSTFGAINMTFTKIFAFGARPTPRPSNNYAEPEPQRGGGGFGGGGGGGGRGGAGGARQIQFSVQVRNLFNSTIRQGINGNLSSPLFGQITGGGQGRSIQLSLQTNLGRLF
jgi:hypothetical protein